MAIPKLALIPAAQGTSLYSVLPANGVGDFNFTRGTVATRINSQGLIETVASGVSRLNYPLIDGVVNGCPSHLLEPLRNNLLSYSEEFDNGAWSKTRSSIDANQIISPSGILNADKFIENTDNNSHQLSRTTSVTAQDYVSSVFIKKGERKKVRLRFDNTLTLRYAEFDLENGVVDLEINSIASIENYGNDWYRCSIKVTATATTFFTVIQLLSDNGDLNYQGDGTSGVYIWGAQLEQGSFPTSYIPTNGSVVTRSAETANGAGDASTFNDSEGVLVFEGSALDESGGNREMTLSDGSTSNRIIVQYRDNSSIRIILAKSTGDEFDTGVLPFNTIERNKIAIKYKTNDFSFWVNGIEIYSDNTGNTFNANTLSKINFDGGTGGNDFYGNTKQIQYFDSALNDSDLETLTSWTSFRDMANGQQYSIK